MKTNRFWIEMIAIGAMIACALALLIATVATGTAAVAEPSDAEAGVASPAASALPQSSLGQSSEATDSPQQTYEGMVTCSRCGAKHSAKFGKTASDCVRVCVHGGAKFALINGDKVYQLEGDLNSLKHLAGQRARITGVMHGDTIAISSIGAS